MPHLYEVAKDTMSPLSKELQRHDMELARQMRRACAAVMLNIAERWRCSEPPTESSRRSSAFRKG